MKTIQFTLDESLLRRIDAEPEVKAKGRSAFLRHAIDAYLRSRQEPSIRDAYRRGYRVRPVRDGEFETPDEALAWTETFNAPDG